MTTTATVETITPSTAERYLALSQGNRPLRPVRVRQYAESMRNGQWVLTGEPIIFNGTALINGHHRLQACIESKTQFDSVVVRGVDETAYDVIDSGLARTMGDVLGQHEVPNRNLVAATARNYLAYCSGFINDSQKITMLISRQTMADHVVNNRELYSWAIMHTEAAKNIRLNGPALAVFRMIVGQEDAHLQLFCDGLLTGASLEVGDPRLTLRTWISNTKVRTAAYHLSGIIRAWNAYVAGVSLANIKPWFKGSPFPVAKTQAGT